MQDIFHKPLIHLLTTNPFFGHLVVHSTKYVSPQIGTAAVGVTSDGILLFANPHFFNWVDKKYGYEAVAEIIKHEYYHVIHNHMGRMSHLLDPKLKDLKLKKDMSPKELDKTLKDVRNLVRQNKLLKRFNICQDLEINQYLPNLPDEFPNIDPATGEIIPYEKDEEGKEVIGGPVSYRKAKEKFEDIEAKLHAEYYWQFFRDKNKEKQEGPNGDPSEASEGIGDLVDSHDLWGATDLSDEAIKEMIRHQVNRAAEKSAGQLPGDIQLALNALNKASVDWRRMFRSFISRSKRTKQFHTRARHNRRTGILTPGVKQYPKSHVVFITDTSGSQTDDILEQCYSELKAAHKAGVAITCIDCDSQVHDVYEFDPKRRPEFKGRGGTAFQPGFDEAAKHQPDAIVYLTDGYNWDNENVKNPGVPVLWGITEGGKKPNLDWGKVVEIKQKMKV